MSRRISTIIGSLLIGSAFWAVCAYILLPLTVAVVLWLYWPDIVRFVRSTVRFTAISALTFTLCSGDRHIPRHNEVTSATIAFN